VKTEDNSKF
jgi:hypothetical protein